jgi:predicted metal-binding protein
MGLIDIATRDTDRGVTCAVLCSGQQVASLEFVKVNNYVLGHVYDADGETLVKFTETLEENDEGIS